jgi:hypothetical protein
LPDFRRFQKIVDTSPVAFPYTKAIEGWDRPHSETLGWSLDHENPSVTKNNNFHEAFQAARLQDTAQHANNDRCKRQSVTEYCDGEHDARKCLVLHVSGQATAYKVRAIAPTPTMWSAPIWRQV